MSSINGRNIEVKCQTCLLPDSPASDDSFGSHERVAKAIGELVSTESGGKAIALEGTWGSGKSTVVTLLQRNLTDADDERDYRTFVFDAWSHQGDPLRRSFLERIIDELSEGAWVSKKEWQQEKEQLARRLKVTESFQMPRLTWSGAFFAITTLMIPIGIAFFAKSDQKTQWMAYVGLCLTAAPFLVLLYAFLRTMKKCVLRSIHTRRSWSLWGDRRATKERIDEACVRTKNWSDFDLLKLLVTKTEMHTRNETTETPDPTSVEFQRIFARLMRDALGDNESRRLIVVIDNLDRIEPKEALSVWSTMRTFFDTDGYPSASWRSRFWLLLPYDPSALTRLWPRDEKDNADKQDGGKEDEYSLLEAFISKTFQIRFQVAPPLLSDWKQYFREQLSRALPYHKDPEELDTVYRLFRWYRVFVL